jgi:hypothetical protein
MVWVEIVHVWLTRTNRVPSFVAGSFVCFGVDFFCGWALTTVEHRLGDEHANCRESRRGGAERRTKRRA